MRWASNEFRAVGRFKKQARVLGLADGALINQHNRLAVIAPLVGLRQPLQVCVPFLRAGNLAVRQVRRHGISALKHCRRHISFLGQPRRNQPSGAVGVTTIIEDDGRTVLELLEHLINLRRRQTIEVGIAGVARQYPQDISSPVPLALRHVFDFAYVRFSGQGVWHADGRQLQRVGLQPIVEVRSTLAGIGPGKDEILEAAIEYSERGHR